MAGKVTLGSFNLSIGTSGSIIGGTSLCYVACDGPGRLVRTANPDSITSYPIGTSTSYNPVGVQTGSGNETFSVGVADTLSPVPDNDSVFVQRMWNISEATPGGNGDVTLQLQWNASDEGTSFSATSCISCRFDSISWTPTGSITDLTGSDPYVATVTGIVEFGDFALSSSGVVSSVGLAEHPGQFALTQNYPNPFNPVTVINYEIPATGNVSLRLYDVLGREVATLVEGEQAAGYHTFTLDGDNLATGVYYYRLTAGSFSDAKRMLLLK